MQVRFRKLDRRALAPTYATEGAAGLDFYALEDVVVSPKEWREVRTGIALEIPLGYELQVRSRSSFGVKRGLVVLTQPGTFDSDFRGEVAVNLINLGILPQRIATGERFAQGVIAPVVHAELREVEELSETPRGTAGVGSTGAF